MKPKICIIVSGGNIQQIHSSSEIEIELIDFDSEPVSTTKQEEIFHKKMEEFTYVY